MAVMHAECLKQLQYHVMIVKYGCWLSNLPDSYIAWFQDVV